MTWVPQAIQFFGYSKKYQHTVAKLSLLQCTTHHNLLFLLFFLYVYVKQNSAFNGIGWKEKWVLRSFGKLIKWRDGLLPTDNKAHQVNYRERKRLFYILSLQGCWHNTNFTTLQSVMDCKTYTSTAILWVSLAEI